MKVIEEVIVPQCGNCLYSRIIEKQTHQLGKIDCHRLPPVQEPGVASPDACPFPVVAEDSWCGEYKPKEEGIEDGKK